MEMRYTLIIAKVGDNNSDMFLVPESALAGFGGDIRQTQGRLSNMISSGDLDDYRMERRGYHGFGMILVDVERIINITLKQ